MYGAVIALEYFPHPIVSGDNDPKGVLSTSSSLRIVLHMSAQKEIFYYAGVLVCFLVLEKQTRNGILSMVYSTGCCFVDCACLAGASSRRGLKRHFSSMSSPHPRFALGSQAGDGDVFTNSVRNDEDTQLANSLCHLSFTVSISGSTLLR